MHVDEVDVAPCTRAHEEGKVAQSIGTVGDGGRSEVHLLFQRLLRLHVLLPRCDGSAQIHASAAHAWPLVISRARSVSVERDLLAVVGLVEAEQMRRRVLVHESSVLHIAGPFAGVVCAIRVQHRHELVPRAEVTMRAGVPVVCPAEVSLQHVAHLDEEYSPGYARTRDVEVLDEVDVVVGDAAAGGSCRLGRSANGERRKGNCGTKADER